MIIFFIIYYSHTDWYIIVQTSKLVTCKKRLIYSPVGLLVRPIMLYSSGEYIQMVPKLKLLLGQKTANNVAGLLVRPIIK